MHILQLKRNPHINALNLTTALNRVPAARPEDGSEEVDARDADTNLGEESRVGQEALEAAVVVEQPGW